MNERIEKVIVHALTFALLVAACNAQLFGMRPFGFSVHLAVLVAGGSPLVSLYFLVAALISAATLPSAVTAGSLAVAGVLTRLALRFVRVRRRVLLRYITHAAVQLALYGVLSAAFGEVRLLLFLSLLTGGGAGVLASFAAPLLAGRDFVRPNAPECAGLTTVTLILFMGVEPLSFGPFVPARMLCSLLTLLAGRSRGAFAAVAAGMVSGAGCALAHGTGGAGVMAMTAVSAMCAAAFSSGARPIPATAAVLGCAGAGYGLGGLGYGVPWELISYAAGALVFVALPPVAVRGIAEHFRPAPRLTAAAAASGMGRLLPERLVRTAEALGDMSVMLTEDAQGDPRFADSLASALTGVCADCERKESCPLSADMRALAADFLAGGGKLKSGILSLPCSGGGRMLRTANESAGKLRALMNAAHGEERSAASYAERLDSLRRLMLRLARLVAEERRYDVATSDKLARDLPECGLACGGALATADRRGIVLLPSGTAPERAERAVSRSLGGVRVERTEDVAPGWTAYSFAPAPRLGVVYAAAQRSLNGKGACGDSWSAVREGGLAMISLCDGSGTGGEAARLSQTTLSLLESHCRAGFDAEDGIASVNAFLSSRAGEEFSALDLVRIDLESGATDIIKAGSPATYLIHGDGLTRIDGSSLPVGALERASYALARKTLVPGDALVLVTDGASDALPDLPELIMSRSPLNARAMAESLLSAALSRGAPKDDMSVLVVRVLEKSE